MVENLERGNLDIKSLIEQYSGKRVEDIFPNSSIIENSLGRFLELTWHVTELPMGLTLSSTKERLISNLKVVDNIGERLETKFRGRGVNTIKDLRWNVKHFSDACKLLELIERKDFMTLIKNKKIFDLDVSFCFKASDFLFLDIETLGLYFEPVILVGLGNYRDNDFEIRLHFARNLDEEMAILEHLHREEFPKFRCFITYNGKSFDIPFLVSRFLYFFDENPLSSSEGGMSGLINSRYHHIDLLHGCRRKYKDTLSRFNLKTVEKQLLSFERDNDLPSSLIGDVYRLYQEDKKKYVGLIKHLIDHNFYDVYSMPLIFEKLLT